VRSITYLPAFLFAALLGACEETDYNIDPLIATDTVELAVPTSNTGLPSALDIPAVGTAVAGRYPERAQDAEAWDLALRVVNGQLALVPAGQIGIVDAAGRSRAAITEAITGKTFEAVREAPRRSEFVTDRAVPLQLGAVYVARSRLVGCGYSASEYYAKLQPVEIDLARQRVRLNIVMNGRCGDQRLVEVEDD